MTELWIGPDGVAIDREPLPRGAEVWDMYGPLNTRYVYLVENGRPAAYPEVLFTSSEKGKGLDELRAAICLTVGRQA